MAKYEYNGETFQIDHVGDCELKVSDGTHNVSISTHTSGKNPFKYSTVGGGWYQAFSVEQAIQSACQELIDARSRASADELCKELTDFVDKLG